MSGQFIQHDHDAATWPCFIVVSSRLCRAALFLKCMHYYAATWHRSEGKLKTMHSSFFRACFIVVSSSFFKVHALLRMHSHGCPKKEVDANSREEDRACSLTLSQ